MNADVLVVGEALVDEVVGVQGVTRHPGGSPANVALGLARLGVATRLHTSIGRDPDGELISRHLISSGVAITPESLGEQPTSRAIARLGGDGSAAYEFALTWDPRQLPVLGSPRLIHTGSLGAWLEPGYVVTRDIVRRGRAGGALVTFDPNLRPSLMPDVQVARPRVLALAGSSHLVKLSDEDAALLFPREPQEAVIHHLLDAGAGVVALTRGGEGALLASGAHLETIPARGTDVADTVGAGDSFMAALIRALAFDGEGWDGGPVGASRLTEVGLFAAYAASLTVSRSGADLPTLADLQPA